MRKETKTRTIIKTVTWRLVATLNSFCILLLFANMGSSDLEKAIYMNISGFFIYYIFERVCNTISYGFKI